VQVKSFATAAPVSTSTANAIEQIGSVAANAIKTFQDKKQQDDLSSAKGELQASFQEAGNVISVVEAAKASGATFDPNTGEVLGGVDNLSPEVQEQLRVINKESKGVFNSIASAVAQGATTQASAALRLESELKRLINANPGFAPELRAQARDIAGYDPSNYQLRRMLNVNQPKKKAGRLTAFDKISEEAEAIVQGFAAGGVTLDQQSVVFMIAKDKEASFRSGLLDSQLKINEIDSAQWLAGRRAAQGAQSSRLLANIAQARNQGTGVVDTQGYLNAVSNAKQETKNQFYQAFAKSGKTLTLDAQNDMSAAIDKDFAEIEKAVKDNDFGKILDNKINTITKLHKLWGIDQNPRLARWANAFGPRIASQIVEVMGSAGSPEQLSLLIDLIPTLKAYVGKEGLTSQQAADKNLSVIDKILRGDNNLTAEDLLFRPAAESIIFGDTMPKDIREQAVLSMGRTAPVRTTAWLSKPDQRRLASDKEVQFMVQQFQINGDKLVNELAAEIAGNTGFNISLEAEGKLSATVAKSLKGVTQNLPTSNNALRQLQFYIDASNNGWSGDLGVSSTFAQDTLSAIKSKALTLNQEEDTTEQLQSQIDVLTEKLNKVKNK